LETFSFRQGPTDEWSLGMTDKELIVKLRKEVETARKAAATWQSKYQKLKNDTKESEPSDTTDLVNDDTPPW